MTKNIVIVVLSLISISSMTFGFYQKNLAEREHELAIEQAQMAMLAQQQAHQAQQEAEAQRRMAEVSLMRAQEQAAIAEALLKKNKK